MSMQQSGGKANFFPANGNLSLIYYWPHETTALQTTNLNKGKDGV